MDEEEIRIIRESFIEFGKKLVEIYEAVKEAVVPVMKTVLTAARNFTNEYIKLLTVNPEIKKCYGIYIRTKSGRIKKKQLTRIIKLSGRIIHGENK